MLRRFRILLVFAFLAAILCLFQSSASAFSVNSGYYVGTGFQQSISGIGFQPDLVIIKADTAAGAAIWRSSAMSGDSSAYFETAAANQAGLITSLDSDGFSIGTDTIINTANVRYTWIAFAGSGGNDFKVGSYTGNGADDRDIAEIGFQPNLTWIKRDGASLGVWYSSSMPADNTHYFSATAPAADRIQAFQVDGFQVGADTQVNQSGQTYFYVTFKSSAGNFAVGSYLGDGLDDRSISGLGFKPDLVLAKQSAVTSAAVLRSNVNYGDESQIFTATANAVDHVQSLEADGFQVGTNARVNALASTYYYFALKGVPAPSPSGSFRIASGSYLGNGSSQSITGAGFKPDLVIIKADTNQQAVFSSSKMAVNSTAYLAGATANFVEGVVSLDSNGFSVGNAATVNSAGITYRWTAFASSGSPNFIVGAYSGNGLDNRSITGLGFQPDMVVVKRSGASLGVWRTASMAGDTSAYFSAAADVPGRIKVLESDGFQIGPSAEVNTLNNLYFYFAFKNTADQFAVGSYTGDGVDNRSISGLGFQPGLVMVKRPEITTAAVHRGANLTGDNAQYFTATANAANIIQALETDGFQIGTHAAVNENLIDYRYAAWSSAPASKLAYVVQPSSAAAGSSISPAITVAVQDTYGNVVASDNSTSVSMAIQNNPGGGTLSGAAAKTAVSGLATFENLSINKTGTGYTLLAAATGLSAATSDAFNITPAAANKLIFTVQPATAEAGTIISPAIKVSVFDQYDNLVTSDNSTQITLAIANDPGAGTLFGTLTGTAAAGVVNFGDLYINKSGAGYTLQASASGLTAGTSEGFDIAGEMAKPSILSISPSREAINVPVASSVKIVFNHNMDQSSVSGAFSFKAVKNNAGVSMETDVTGSSTWDALSRTFTFTPGAALTKGYTYRASLAAAAKDAEDIFIASSESWTFTALLDHNQQNVVYSEDGQARVSLGSSTLPVDGTVSINRAPRANPTITDPAKITSAINKVLAEGNPFHYPITASITEFVYFDSTGTHVTTRFAESAVLALYFTDNDNDGIVDGTDPPIRKENLLLYRLDENAGLWVRVPGSAVNTADNYVYAPSNSFSVYTIMSTAALNLNTAYAFPNPFKPASGHTTVTFTNLASQCTIKVFTIAGDLVKTIQETDGDGQNTWDVKNGSGEMLSSGLYIYLIKSSDDTKTGKLVIIR